LGEEYKDFIKIKFCKDEQEPDIHCFLKSKKLLKESEIRTVIEMKEFEDSNIFGSKKLSCIFMSYI